MKKTWLVIIIVIIFFGCSAKKELKYFDENKNQINKIEFDEKLKTTNFIGVTGDSSNFQKLVYRSKGGYINDKETLIALFEKQTQQAIDRNEPVIIFYHHKKPSLNSQKWMLEFYPDLENGIAQICNSKPVYLYRDKKESKKKIGNMIWYNDPQKIVERLFINNNETYYNFVILSKSDLYICVLGEFSREMVFSATKKILK